MRVVLTLLGCLLALEAWALQAEALVTAARQQVGVTLGYDPAYRRLSYPNGDVPLDTGVCSDVLIRALRQQGLDLQQAVHQDMRANFALYPKNWGLSRPDRNIDHRRVPNLMTWFKRQGWALLPGRDAEGYRPGDIVTWDLGGGLGHIGIISDRQAASGVPLVLHNIGRGTQEEDILFGFKITGHYRIPVG
jgi:uncharacterized protein YijF (DUF1287 family)